MARAGVALCALVLATVGAVGCGEEEGVAEGATVHAYVEAPLCEVAAPVARVEDESGEEVSVRFVCLPAARGAELSQGVGGGRRIDLAVAGANARRATEDSTTVAYLQPAVPRVTRFTRPILEAAGVGWVAADTGREGAAQLISLIEEADSSSLRADVREALGQG